MNKIEIDISKGWTPDYLRFAMPKGGLITCKNLMPLDEYYAVVRGKSPYSSSVASGTPLGAREFMNKDGQRYLFVGTSTKLYRLETDQTLSDISKVSTTYTNLNTRWYFERYGDWIIATNYKDAPQVLKGLTASNFIDLGGNPPKAKFSLMYKNQLILAYIDKNGTETPNGIAWSARDNMELFGQSIPTGADSKVLADVDGKISGLAYVQDKFAILHDHAISLGYYNVGPYGIELIQNAVKNIGAIEGTIIPYGKSIFFFDEKNFYYFDGVSDPVPIGDGIKRTILLSLDLNNTHRNTTAIDLRNGILFWSFKSLNAATRPDTIVACNPKKLKFTKIELDHECIFNLYRPAATIDGLSTYYPTIDELDFQFDSNLWQATTFVGCMDSDGKVKLLVGNPLTGEIEAVEIYSVDDNGMFDDHRLAVSKIYPKVQKADANSVKISIGVRNELTEDPTYSTEMTVGSNGYANTRASGKYLSCKMSTGNHNGIFGITADGRKAGRR